MKVSPQMDERYKGIMDKVVSWIQEYLHIKDRVGPLNEKVL